MSISKTTLASELERVCAEHAVEYRRREDLWRKRQLDIMQLGCPELNDEIERVNIRLSMALGLPFTHNLGNQELIELARSA